MILRISLLLVFFSVTAGAQSKQDFTDAFHTGGNEFQFWGGYSPTSPTWIGKTDARHLFMAGVGWRRVILASDSVAWKFTVDIVPVALLSQPTLNRVETVFDPRKFTTFCSTAGGNSCGRRTTYGIGFAPVGFEFNFRRKRRIQPVLGINAGLLHFTRDVPVDHSMATNFTFSWGGGVQIFARESRSILVGYRFHHISNANSSNVNPGVDSNFIYAGYSFHR
jgi:opacity protein-like surface antigen